MAQGFGMSLFGGAHWHEHSRGAFTNHAPPSDFKPKQFRFWSNFGGTRLLEGTPCIA